MLGLGVDHGDGRPQLVGRVGGEAHLPLPRRLEPVEGLVERRGERAELALRLVHVDPPREVRRGDRPGRRAHALDRAEDPPRDEPAAQETQGEDAGSDQGKLEAEAGELGPVVPERAPDEHLRPERPGEPDLAHAVAFAFPGRLVRTTLDHRRRGDLAPTPRGEEERPVVAEDGEVELVLLVDADPVEEGLGEVDLLRRRTHGRTGPARRVPSLEALADRVRRAEELVLPLVRLDAADPRVERDGEARDGEDEHRPVPELHGPAERPKHRPHPGASL